MTPIEWTDDTWNPIVGCSIVSKGCTHCYAMRQAARIERMNPTNPATGYVNPYDGTTKKVNGNTVWTGKVALAEAQLMKPLKRRKPTMYFVNSMGDVFHGDVPDEWIDRVFAVMALCPQHTFQILTKRPERMRAYLDRPALRTWDHSMNQAAWEKHAVLITGDPCAAGVIEDRPWPLPNVWLGTSVEDQETADERIPHLLETPAAIRFVSAEPLLGRLDFTRIYKKPGWLLNSLNRCDDGGAPLPSLDWIITGGESGPGSRPAHYDWFRSIRDQCAAAGVAYLHKQNGDWLHESQDPNGLWDWAYADERNVLHHWPDGTASMRVGKKAAGRLLDGVEHNGFPTAKGGE